ncbi:MAG TPA: PAS domain S-box protein [bacterium]|nr:PAS domain S-box protein [bacterium]
MMNGKPVILKDLEKLKESEEKYRTLIENIPHRVFMVDEKYRVISANRAALLTLGKTEDEVIGHTTIELFPRESAFKYMENIKKVFETGKPFSTEEELLTPDSQIFVIVHLNPVKNELGQTIRVLGLISDISESKLAERKAKASEIRYRRLFESAKDGILILDYETGTVVNSNPFIEHLLEYSSEELEGKELWEIGTFKDIVASKEAYSKLQIENYVRYENLPLKTKYGKTVEVEFVSNVYLVDSERVIQCNIRDITERKQTEAMRKAREIAESANRTKSDFLANMSHELRTPLNAIIGFSEVLYDETFGSLNKKQKDYMNDVLTSGRHLLSLVNEILDISKVESGKMILEKTSFSLNQLLEQSLVLIREKSFKHDLHVSLEITDEINDISADERKIKQVIYNLLANAVKFTPDGGKICIKARKNNDQIEISVHDTGIGIAKDDLDKIFQRFSQIGDIYTKKPNGTGLGLALSKSLVELHGGKIWVESEGPDKGSTFLFSLPIKQKAEQEKIR